MKQDIYRKKQTGKRENRVNRGFRKGGLPYRILSVVMVLILVMTTSAFGELEISTKAAGAYDTESWDISVTINGAAIETVEKISPGDELKVDVKGILKDNEIYTSPYEKTVDLNTLEGVVIPEVSNAPLQVNGVVVGHADVMGGKIIITLEDVDSFLTGKKGREVNATISGYIAGSKDDHESGDHVDITIQSRKYSFVWDNKDEELTLGVQKQLGDFVMNADGSGKQYYTIRVNGGWVGDNENATATLTSITDVSGDSLSSPAGFEIKENTTTGNDASLAVGNTISDLSRLNNTVYKRNEYITVSYYMTVTKEAVSDYLETGNGNSALENTAQIAYLTNKKGTGSGTSTVNTIRASRLNVTKTLDSGATDEQQTWTITVDVGASYSDSKPNLSDYLDAISDVPGEGLIAAGGASLGLSDFTPDGNGKFTAKYTTSLTDEYKNSESTTVKNEVKVTPKGKTPYSIYADYVTTGNGTGALVEKAFTSYDPAQRILT